MTNLVVKIFPAGAVLFSIYACMFPQGLNKLSFLIIPLLGFIMFGMGATLSGRDFVKTAGKMNYVLLGIVLQFVLMPILAYLTASLLALPREQFIGLVMVGCVAGGTASNVITFLAGGDVPLSITMTACSTLVGIFATPAISSVLLGQMVHIPAVDMFKSIVLVVFFPVLLGLLVNRIFRKHTDTIKKTAPVISVAAIIFVIGIIVSLNVKNIYACGILIMAAVIIHNALGMFCGYWIARLFKCDKKSAITIAIEVGMQNSGLAAALSAKYFGAAAALPGAVFSIWHNISGAVFSSFSRRMTK